MSRNELLANWFEYDLIVWSAKAECGYEWTQKAKKLVPIHIRTILMVAAHDKRIKQSETFKLAVHHFDKKGFYHGKTKSS